MSKYEIISLIINGIIALAGFSAIIIYKFQERNRIRTAATLIVTQIDSIETGVRALREADELTEKTVYQLKQVLAVNYWAENRHLLSRKLGEHNVKTIENFYSQAEEIEKSRVAICDETVNTWHNKDLIFQYHLSCEFLESDEKEEPSERLINFLKRGSGFVPGFPMEALKKNLQNFEIITNGVAYGKLRKMSYHS